MSAARPGAGLAVKVAPPRRPAPRPARSAPLRSTRSAPAEDGGSAAPAARGERAAGEPRGWNRAAGPGTRAARRARPVPRSRPPCPARGETRPRVAGWEKQRLGGPAVPADPRTPSRSPSGASRRSRPEPAARALAVTGRQSPVYPQGRTSLGPGV